MSDSLGSNTHHHHEDMSLQLPAFAVCHMESHSKDYVTKGTVRFTQKNVVGVEISGTIEGLTPNSLHAFHIHELGDLTNGCTSLASHYNPFGEDHGGPDSCHRHVGDLGNLQADVNGIANFNFTDLKISIVGPLTILGRSCVVHLFADDLGHGGTEDSLKTGSAGPRIGCGVVGRAVAFT